MLDWLSRTCLYTYVLERFSLRSRNHEGESMDSRAGPRGKRDASRARRGIGSVLFRWQDWRVFTMLDFSGFASFSRLSFSRPF